MSFYDALDLRSGRKPISQAWLDQGWQQRTTWAVVLPSCFPPRTVLVCAEHAKDGFGPRLSIEGFDVIDTDDGA